MRKPLRILIYVCLISLPIAKAKAIGTSSTSSRSSSGGLGGGGNDAFSFYGGTINTSQDALNTMQQRSNTRAGGITGGQLTSAYEIGGGYMYRFDSSIYAIQIRPMYFYQRTDGSGSPGQYTYAVQGWTVFPILRLYPMENDIMKFFLQIGMGYGQVTGHVSEGQGVSATFGSGAFGTMVGMGAEFCFSPQSCFSFEGNYRYLDFIRNIVTASSGTFASNSLSQYGVGQEAELDNNDVDLRMSGLQMLAGYTYWF